MMTTMRWTPMTQNNVADLLLRAHERTTLDFKEVYDLSDLDKDDTRFELAKDIAALANNVGGTLLVGAVEDRRTSRIARFDSIQDPARMIKTIDEGSGFCLPVPLAQGVIVELDPDEQQRILRRPGVQHDVTLVAVNVPPYLNGPVAVKVWDGKRKGASIADAYRFPLRGAEGTPLPAT